VPLSRHEYGVVVIGMGAILVSFPVVRV
jgi:hypothetical protein